MDRNPHIVSGAKLDTTSGSYWCADVLVIFSTCLRSVFCLVQILEVLVIWDIEFTGGVVQIVEAVLCLGSLSMMNGPVLLADVLQCTSSSHFFTLLIK